MQKYIDMLLDYLSKRSRLVERKIYSYYIEMLDYILAELGKLYQKSETDGTLNRNDVRRYKRLDKLKRSVVTSSKIMSKKKQDALQEHLEQSYTYSYDWMSWAVQKESQVAYDAPLLREEIAEKAITNEIAKIKLPDTLERQRKKVVQDINSEIERGINNTETYAQVAQRVTQVVEGDRTKAIRTTRTETKRVREQATVEATQKANSEGVIMRKKWLSMKDERVRDTVKANHRKMHGQTVPVNEPFDLGNGVLAQTPGLSGTPHNDIGCRCLTTYKVVGIKAQTDEQVAKRTFVKYQSMRGEL